MEFLPDGQWVDDGDRPRQPPGVNIRQHMVAHHIISLDMLCNFWNRLIEQRAAANNVMQIAYLDGAIVSYIQIVGYLGSARNILHLIQNHQVPRHHPLEAALCWQRYNLFEGPTNNPDYGRPAHFPDPAANLDSPLGRCAHEHIIRVGRLRQAAEYMEDFLVPNASMSTVHGCLGQLNQVRHLEIIRVHDINWYGLMPFNLFTALTEAQRIVFFEACYTSPGPTWRKTAAQVEQAYNTAVAPAP